ncbi:MAG: hypothetical protein H6Q43_1660 [Deltaproteobacteria bacterium]|nr:hypothetical protein [Deltaproteobacteria bacterium]
MPITMIRWEALDKACGCPWTYHYPHCAKERDELKPEENEPGGNQEG